jgi:hypothetical protein
MDYRQGDVYLERLPLAGPVLGKTLAEPTVLLSGDHSGHHHTVLMAKADLEASVIEIEAPTKLVHEEHGEMDIEPGVYRVHRPREYEESARPRQVYD